MIKVTAYYIVVESRRVNLVLGHNNECVHILSLCKCEQLLVDRKEPICEIHGGISSFHYSKDTTFGVAVAAGATIG